MALVKHFVNDFFVELGAECNGCEALGLAAGEHCRAVRSGQIVDFAPDGADFVGFAAVEADAFVENAATHGFFFNVVVVALDQRSFFVLFFFGQRCDVFVADCCEAVGAPVLVGAALLCNRVGFVVAFFANVLAELFVVDFVAVFALGVAYFLGQFHLGHALHLDGFVGGLEGVEQNLLADFVHFAFDHHDVVVGGANHQLEVCVFQFFEGGVDNEVSVNACNAHFGNRALEGNVRN